LFFEKDKIYHVYNRGNNRQPIFFERDNYIFFLEKIGRLKSYSEVLSWCLMPNHFHLMLYVNNDELNKNTNQQNLSIAIGKLLSSYAQAINKRFFRSGSLFQGRTKAIDLLEKKDEFYPLICFNYIHQNPMKAGLVKRMEDWEFSSARDYFGLRTGNLCSIDKTIELLDLPTQNISIRELSYQILPDEVISGIF
jgi:putative transposase